MLNPRLFIVFVNELESMLRKSEYRGISMGNAIEIFLLMYADDIVLLGDTVLELQRKIRVLEEFCGKWGMEVNLTKTKAVVFRNGGVMSKSVKFSYRGEKVKTFTYYRYLRFIFSSKNLWSKALSTLAAQGEKVLSIVRRIIYGSQSTHSLKLLLKFSMAGLHLFFVMGQNPGIRTTSPNRTSSHRILQIYFRP